MREEESDEKRRKKKKGKKEEYRSLLQKREIIRKFKKILERRIRSFLTFIDDIVIQNQNHTHTLSLFISLYPSFFFSDFYSLSILLSLTSFFFSFSPDHTLSLTLSLYVHLPHEVSLSTSSTPLIWRFRWNIRISEKEQQTVSDVAFEVNYTLRWRIFLF